MQVYTCVETASHAVHCPVSGKLKLNCIQGIWGAGQEQRPQCPVVGSIFPHPCVHIYIYIICMYILSILAYVNISFRHSYRNLILGWK